jgi:hypothetical protein
LRIHEYAPRVLALVVLQSMVIHLLAVALIYICSVHSRAGLDFLRVFVATPIGLLVNAIPLSPGGLGIGENAFELLYATVGGRNGATSFLARARVPLLAGAGGLVYVLKRMVTRKRSASAPRRAMIDSLWSVLQIAARLRRLRSRWASAPRTRCCRAPCAATRCCGAGRRLCAALPVAAAIS